MPIMMRIAFLLLGLLAAAASIWLRNMNLKAASWPGIEGEITHSGLDFDPTDGSRSVHITYRFVLGNREFTSNQITYGLIENSLSAKQNLVDTYPVGRIVRIYYDPGDPSCAVLIRGESNLWIWLFVVGAIFMLFSLITS
jgi:Protein of unknown function (DUF3592)